MPLAPQRIPLVVTYHPAYLLRSPTEKRKAWEDLKFARRVFNGATLSVSRLPEILIRDMGPDDVAAVLQLEQQSLSLPLDRGNLP